MEATKPDPRTLRSVLFLLHCLQPGINNHLRRLKTSPIVTIDRQTQVRPPLESSQSAPVAGESPLTSTYIPAKLMLQSQGRKTKIYRDNRDFVLEILQTAVGIISDDNGPLSPVGGAIISKLLQNVQVMSSCYIPFKLP
jgi:hypothetical protein